MLRHTYKLYDPTQGLYMGMLTRVTDVSSFTPLINGGDPDPLRFNQCFPLTLGESHLLLCRLLA